ncbi:hypothetical protein SAY87_018495 [Trapa incisa]|uniref:Uncharacterized protein n=1 Tax=Trapa incisa TaxID=236973 RepID=A0AAN7QX31_9MYRT|nr:hypothetical protein SAY87_018495 [Trapa incisa]
MLAKFTSSSYMPGSNWQLPPPFPVSSSKHLPATVISRLRRQQATITHLLGRRRGQPSPSSSRRCYSPLSFLALVEASPPLTPAEVRSVAAAHFLQP